MRFAAQPYYPSFAAPLRSIVRAAIAIVILLLSQQWASANPYPIQIKKDLILCQANINGKDVTLLLDSGAPGLVLNSRYYTTNETDSQLCQGINGSFSCPSVQIKSFDWLGVHFKNTDALLSDLSFLETALQQKIDGLAGLTLLNDFYVTLDIDKNAVSVSKKTDKATAFTKFQYVDHVPAFRCKVNGESLLLGMDTGAETNYLFAPPTTVPRHLSASSQTVVVTGTENRYDIKHIQTMQLEILSTSQKTQIEFVFDPEGNSHLTDLLLDGLLGQSFLSQYNIVIHPGKRLISLRERS